MAGNQQETDEEKAAREEAEQKAFEERVGKVVDARMNKAISSHLKRAKLDGVSKDLEDIKALLQGRKSEGAEGDGDGGENDDGAQGEGGEGHGGQPRGADGKLKAKQDPELVARLRTLENAQKAAEKRAAEAEKKNQEMEARRRIDEENDLSTKALLGLGIKDEVQLESALLFHRGKGRIIRDEETGKPLFKRKDASGEDEVVPLEIGLKEWGKTEEAKRFLPATSAGGSGGTGGASGRPGAGGGKNGKGTPSDEQFGRTIAGLLFGVNPDEQQ